MGLKRALFLRILVAELEDLDEDILLIEERYRHRFEELKLSQYVFLENRALLEREKACIQGLIDEVRKMDPTCCPTVEDVADRVLSELDDQVKRFEFPEVVKKLVARKIKKVVRYIRSGVGSSS